METLQPHEANPFERLRVLGRKAIYEMSLDELDEYRGLLREIERRLCPKGGPR